MGGCRGTTLGRVRIRTHLMIRSLESRPALDGCRNSPTIEGVISCGTLVAFMTGQLLLAAGDVLAGARSIARRLFLPAAPPPSLVGA